MGGRLRELREKASAWRSDHINDQTLVFILAIITGAAAGVGATALKMGIEVITHGFTRYFNPAGPNWAILMLPVIGIMLTGWYQRHVVHADLTHCVRHIGVALKSHRYALPPYLCYAPGIATSITLGFGGSAGAEGPVAYIGAAIGSNVARVCRLKPRLMLIMLACGAGAGIAGIFKAPVGGFLFTLEVLRLELSTISVVACLLACVTSAIVVDMLSGFSVDLTTLQAVSLDTRLLPYLVLLGLACGLYSLYYSYIMSRMESFYDSLRRPWVRNLVSGAVLAVIVFVFPSMYGEGYDVMSLILDGDPAMLSSRSIFSGYTSGAGLVLVAGAIVALKAFACSASNCGGGVAGDFAPTLYAGCVLGFFFASALNVFFATDLPVGVFAFCAMSGVMSGVIRAPLMAVFLTAEMTSGSVQFLPLLIVSGVSYIIMWVMKPQKMYSTI